MAQKTEPRKLGVKLRRKETAPTDGRGGLKSNTAKHQTAIATKRADMQMVREQEGQRAQYSRSRSRRGAPQLFTDPTAGKIRVQIDGKTNIWIKPGTNLQDVLNTYANRPK